MLSYYLAHIDLFLTHATVHFYNSEFFDTQTVYCYGLCQGKKTFLSKETTLFPHRVSVKIK